MELISVYTRPDSLLQLWHLLGERDGTEAISHEKMPSWTAHKAFVESKPYRAWYLIVVDNRIAGSVYATWRNEVGVQVFTDCRRRGYAREALRILMNLHDPLEGLPGVRADTWLANINPRNLKSVALFKELGFEHVQNTYALRHR